MSVTRACRQCRNAKGKCDLVRPSCGRCSQRGLTCSGYPTDEGFIFRDERETAQRNSERARRELREGPSIATPIDILSPSAAHTSQSQSTNEDSDLSLEQQYHWLTARALAEVPGPLKRDIESRAVDRFFVNWVLWPCNHGVTPGHYQDLPSLYVNAPAESVLYYAVRAVAFADVKDVRSGTVQFSIKARQAYGAALARMRMVAEDEQELAHDRVLASLLLIDNFELMYLARTQPLGPHRDAVRHILRARGDEQFFHPSKYALWRAASHRLQARQMLLREEPDADQVKWISKLNIARPDIHISADVLHINILVAAVKKLTEGAEEGPMSTPAEKISQAVDLARSMEALIDSIVSWTSEMIGVWKPQQVDSRHFTEGDDLVGFPIPAIPCPRVLTYHDKWLAYMWTFHAASQIVLRESLVGVLRYLTLLQGGEIDAEDMQRIQTQQAAVDELSKAIIRSIPPLLGFRDATLQGPGLHIQGKMTGRYFCLFTMLVVQNAEFTSDEHKEVALRIRGWINARHGLI